MTKIYILVDKGQSLEEAIDNNNYTYSSLDEIDENADLDDGDEVLEITVSKVRRLIKYGWTEKKEKEGKK